MSERQLSGPSIRPAKAELTQGHSAYCRESNGSERFTGYSILISYFD